MHAYIGYTEIDQYSLIEHPELLKYSNRAFGRNLKCNEESEEHNSSKR